MPIVHWRLLKLTVAQGTSDRSRGAAYDDQQRFGLHWFDSRSLRSQCRSADDGAVCRRHLSDMATGQLLEVAAGTGIVTGALALALPRAQLIATDLNQPMLDHAATKPELRGVEFRQADAQCQPEESPET